MTLLAFLRTSPLWTLLGWTAMLSLTLGGAAAATALLGRRLAPRLTARRRYQLVALAYMVSALVALPIAVAPRARSIEGPPVLSTSYAVRAPAGTMSPDASGPVVMSMHVTPSQPGAGAVVVPVLAVVWFGAAAVAALRLLAGLWMIRGIARRATRIEDPTLDTLLDHVKQRMNVRARITLRESPDVDTAVTGGCWRPFVLLPTGMTKSLATPDLELVLAHELAHVRRRDFPVAIVQAVGDVATTLSPGHRWLSSEASRLREEACDDAVVAMGVEPTQYARVLEGLARWSRGLRVSPAVCAANRHLVDRVQRLLSNRTSSMPRVRATLAVTVGLCLAIAATSLVAKASPGLPAPGGGHHLKTIGANLMSWREWADGAASAPQQTQNDAAAFLRDNAIFPGYSFHQQNSPVRLSDVVASREHVYEQVTVRNVFAKRIASLTFAAIIERLPGPVTVVRSVPVATAIDPDQSAVVASRLLSIDQASTSKHGGTIQPLLVVVAVTFEDHSVWKAQLEEGAQTSSAALGARPLALPRSFVSSSLPISAKDIPSCYSGYTEDDQQTQGAIVPIRDEQNKWARCIAGRWVEVDITKMGPEHTVEDMRHNGVIAPSPK